MSISNLEHEKEGYLVDQEALGELQNYIARKQTMFETMQKINEMDLKFADWQLLCEEAYRILDKISFEMFFGIALDKMADVASSFAECKVVLKMAGKRSKVVDKLLQKMTEFPKSDDEKWEMERLIEKNEESRRK